ncbi:MAG: DNA recombination protein RmuC [Chlamydiae bacterium]|nr:DNA recombination protein RmuC [Chlamydiota bacterium]
MMMTILLIALSLALAGALMLLVRYREERARLRAALQADAEKLQWAETSRAALVDAFKACASDVLHANSAQLEQRSRSALENLVKPLTNDLASLDMLVRALESKREGAYQALGQQLTELGRLHAQLQSTTTTLAQALRSPTVKGRWGELQLRRLVEMAGMAGHVDFDEQAAAEAGPGRPDMVIRLPQGGILPIDSKVPLDAYLEAMETREEAARAAKLAQHAKAMRGKVNDLGRKAYWDQFERAPEIVVMFVPLEASLSAAFEQDRDLFEYAIANRVLISSPVILFALLKVIAFGWQQQRLAENAERIAEEGRELYGRLATFVGHFSGVGEALEKSVKGYNRAVASLESRLIPLARRFQEMGVARDEIPDPAQLDIQPRTPAALPGEGGDPRP